MNNDKKYYHRGNANYSVTTMIIAYYKSPKCGIIYKSQRRAMNMNTRSFIHNPKGLLREAKKIVH